MTDRLRTLGNLFAGMKGAQGGVAIVHGLEKKGFLRSKQQQVNGRIRRVYMATGSGRKALEAGKQRVRELFGEMFERKGARGS